jgi:hypothetical protein
MNQQPYYSLYIILLSPKQYLILVKSCTHDLINGSHLECCASISMQELDENSWVFYNFINSFDY